MQDGSDAAEPAHDEGRDLAAHVVAGCLAELEHAGRGWRGNQYVMRALHCAVTLLGEAQLAARFERLVPESPEQRAYIQRPAHVVDALYPPHDEERVQALVHRLSQSSPHIACCVGQNYAQALALAKRERERAEVALTQLALGDFGAAEQFTRDHVRPEYRSHGVRLVLVVELFRRRLYAQGRQALAELPALEQWDLWHRAQLALGLLGRDMWPGYPYPDH